MSDKFVLTPATYGFHDNVSSEDSWASHRLIEDLKSGVIAAIGDNDDREAERLNAQMNMLLRVANAKQERTS